MPLAYKHPQRTAPPQDRPGQARPQGPGSRPPVQGSPTGPAQSLRPGLAYRPRPQPRVALPPGETEAGAAHRPCPRLPCRSSSLSLSRARAPGGVGPRWVWDTEGRSPAPRGPAPGRPLVPSSALRPPVCRGRAREAGGPRGGAGAGRREEPERQVRVTARRRALGRGGGGTWLPRPHPGSPGRSPQPPAQTPNLEPGALDAWAGRGARPSQLAGVPRPTAHRALRSFGGRRAVRPEGWCGPCGGQTCPCQVWPRLRCPRTWGRAHPLQLGPLWSGGSARARLQSSENQRQGQRPCSPR